MRRSKSSRRAAESGSYCGERTCSQPNSLAETAAPHLLANNDLRSALAATLPDKGTLDRVWEWLVDEELSSIGSWSTLDEPLEATALAELRRKAALSLAALAQCKAVLRGNHLRDSGEETTCSGADEPGAVATADERLCTALEEAHS